MTLRDRRTLALVAWLSAGAALASLSFGALGLLRGSAAVLALAVTPLFAVVALACGITARRR